MTADSTGAQFSSDGLVGWQSVTRTSNRELLPDSRHRHAGDQPSIAVGGTAEQPGGLAFVAQTGLCSASPLEFAVDTWLSNGALSNSVAFTAVVP